MSTHALTDWSVNRLAARAIALAEHLPLTERRELLDVAGLIGPAGVSPDDRHVYDDLTAWLDEVDDEEPS